MRNSVSSYQISTLIWLQKHHKRFGQIVATIKKKEGKTVVHDNLLIAAVKNLSLRVLIEKKFSDSKQVVTLSDEFISFPLNLLPAVLAVSSIMNIPFSELKYAMPSGFRKSSSASSFLSSPNVAYSSLFKLPKCSPACLLNPPEGKPFGDIISHKVDDDCTWNNSK